jgi:hypothetical protein
MSEVPYIPPFELWKTDHGIDGHDARTWLVARFTTRQKAFEYLRGLGYSYPQHGHYYCEKVEGRHTMGALSYEIREKYPDVPVDPS